MSKKNGKNRVRHAKHQWETQPGNLPPGFTLRLASNYGTSEPYVSRIWIQSKDLLKYMDLPNADEADFRLDRILEQLEVARVHLGRIESKSFTKLPTFDQQAEYVAFYNAIWWAYKDRFKNFMNELGFDLGFVFQSDENFEKGAERFLKLHPNFHAFIDVARQDRNDWQGLLAAHRNNLHSGDRRGEKHDPDNPKDARVIFDNVWQSIEEKLVYLGGEVMQEGWVIVEIPEDERNKDVPVRFKAYLKGLLDGTIKLPPL